MQNWKKQTAQFMISQTVSLLGSMLVMYAILWHITLSTDSGLMMTLYVLATFIPALLVAPFAGVWADRLNRKNLMIFADLLIAVVTLIIAILFILNIRDLWIVFIISIVRSIGQTIHQPAVSAVYPSIVPKDYLLKVQGINQGIQSSSMILMPLLAGLLLAILPLEYILLIDVFTAGIAVLMLIYFIEIPAPKQESSASAINYFLDIKAGFNYARKHTFIISILIFSFIFMFLVAAPSFLSYLQVARVFGAEAWRLSLLEALFGIGMLLGSIVITAWGGFKNRLHTYFISFIFIGIGTMGLGIPFNFWVYIGFWAFVGFFISLGSPVMVALIQEKVEPDFIGRIFSVFGLIQTASLPLGMLLFGPLSDVFDISNIILMSGIGMVLISIVVLFRKKLMINGLKEVTDNNDELEEKSL